MWRPGLGHCLAVSSLLCLTSLAFQVLIRSWPTPHLTLTRVDTLHYDHTANVNVSDRLKVYRQRVMLDGECKTVARDPLSFWRSQKTTANHFSADDDYERMSKAVECGGLMIPEYLLTPVRKELYPFERDHFEDDPCDDHLAASSERFSTLKLLNQSTVFKVGDRVVLEITMRDGRGNPRSKGCDVIRVWLKDVRFGGAKVAARVVDLKNGTYLAFALLPWTGQPQIVAALAYPREYIRALLYAQHSIKYMKGVTGKFENSEASETTPCYTTPVLPGFSPEAVCNLTHQNGSPWYCGRPLKRHLLSCRDYKATRNLPIPKYLPLTDAEMTLLKRTTKNPRIRRIAHNISITVKENAGGQTRLLSPRIPCHKIQPTLTWDQEEPTGYLADGRWNSFLCTPTPFSNRCLFNKKILLLGDSNCRTHYYHYVALTKCHQVKKAQHAKWHAPLMCIHDRMRFNMSWLPHSQPFMANTRVYTKIEDLTSSARVMDETPVGSGQLWVILNHFTHLTPFHMSAIEEKMQSLKEGLMRLFDKHPKALVVVQGPHISWNGWPIHYAGGGSLVHFIVGILKDVFKELHHRVFYLSTHDMTIAAENRDFHPPIAHQFTAMINGFLCDG